MYEHEHMHKIWILAKKSDKKNVETMKMKLDKIYNLSNEK